MRKYQNRKGEIKGKTRNKKPTGIWHLTVLLESSACASYDILQDQVSTAEAKDPLRKWAAEDGQTSGLGPSASVSAVSFLNCFF